MTGYRVLIVDDSRFMRQVLSDIVNRDDSFTVAATASDGEEAVRLVAELKPDIVTMDMEMPRMNGLEALQRIMAAHPLPVIMLSAVTDNGMRDTIRALQYGAFDFIRKPDSAVNLDFREVRDYLLDKLRIASESLRQGSLRMLPAVRDSDASRIVPPTPSLGAIEVAQLPDAALKHGPPEVSEQVKARPEASPKAIPKPSSRDGHTNSVADHAAPLTGPAPPVRKPPITAIPDSGVNEVAAIHPVKTPSWNKKQPPPLKRIEDPETKPPPQTSSMKPAAKPKAHLTTSFNQIVAVGTSTGGPRALHEVLTKLPADFEAPVLVVQHMPPKFTHSLAQRLDSFCEIRVCEAVHDERVVPATVYIAPGGNQMSLSRDTAGAYRIRLTNEGPRNGHMPSVDVLFESLVGKHGLKRHVILMTGMGSDGAKGMKALQGDGVSTLIAESEETCVVYGMPRSAVELGAVNRVLPLGQIGPEIVREVRSSSK